MPETRAELEARLKAASDSMSKRLASMEDEVSIPGVSKVRKALGNDRTRKLFVAAGVGLAVGLIFGGRGPGKKGDPSASMAEWRRDLADILETLLERGAPPQEIAERAARALPPVIKDQDDGIFAFMAGYAVRTVGRHIVRDIVNRVQARNGSEDDS